MKPPDFYQLPMFLFQERRNKHLSELEIFVFSVVATYCKHSSGRAFTGGYEALAKLCGTTKGNIKLIMTKIKSLGYVVVERGKISLSDETRQRIETDKRHLKLFQSVLGLDLSLRQKLLYSLLESYRSTEKQSVDKDTICTELQIPNRTLLEDLRKLENRKLVFQTTTGYQAVSLDEEQGAKTLTFEKQKYSPSETKTLTLKYKNTNLPSSPSSNTSNISNNNPTISQSSDIPETEEERTTPEISRESYDLEMLKRVEIIYCEALEKTDGFYPSIHEVELWIAKTNWENWKPPYYTFATFFQLLQRGRMKDTQERAKRERNRAILKIELSKIREQLKERMRVA